ncbi:hypothetical protein [Modicisalibacter radicis]|uniref:hypothetical protein n=1 Tax=Halomonas sp. EAR18 TaxID=2518972 RepID=UPI00109CB015|nr:hypothetical protein [Halomonas sp. EAR18]
MRLKIKPVLTCGVLLSGCLLLSAALPAVADEQRYGGAFDGQSFGSDIRQGDDSRRRYDDHRRRWQDARERGHGYDGRDRGHRDFDRDYRGHYRDERWHYGRDDHGYRHDGRRHDGRDWHRDRDRYGHHGRPGWAPNVEVIVDGVSSDNRPPYRAPSDGPDRCHQVRSDSWSTGSLDCPEPKSPARGQEWSSSP